MSESQRWCITVDLVIDADTASDAMDEAARQLTPDLAWQRMNACAMHNHMTMDIRPDTCVACKQIVTRTREIAESRRNRS
jgi:hypothetical protein